MSYNNNYRNNGYKKRTVSPFLIFALAGLFFVALMYEVTSDGVTALFEWLPGIEWANMAGDVVVNVLQIVIFSFVASLTGTSYQSGRTTSGHYKRKSPDEEYIPNSREHNRRIQQTDRQSKVMKKNNKSGVTHTYSQKTGRRRIK